MAFRLLKRLVRHFFTLPGAVNRHFSKVTMKRIEDAIAASEQAHFGEIRFAVETRLSLLDILRNKSVKKRAIEVFSQLRVWDTEQNNGVLIYLLLADHGFEIVADRGVHLQAGQQHWHAISKQMEVLFRQGQFEAGVLYGVDQIGEILTQHYPTDGPNKNELANAPVII